MPDMHHEVWINTPPEKVYEAITTAEGLRGWWTDDLEADPRVGSTAEFGFNNRSTLFRMRIVELTPGKRVVWECLGDPDEWKGTRLSWEVSEKEGNTILNFVHANWSSTAGYFALCNSTWGELMHRMKAYLEGKEPGPHFTS